MSKEALTAETVIDEPAVVGESGWCPRCDEFRVIAKTCHCKRFDCGQPWNGEVDCWTEIYAQDAESAAEKYSENYDCDGEYTIIRRGSAEVWTRDRSGNIQKWDVEAESVPSYNAREKTA